MFGIHDFFLEGNSRKKKIGLKNVSLHGILNSFPGLL